MAKSEIKVAIDLDAQDAVRGLEDMAEAATDTATAVEELDQATVAVDTGQAENALTDVKTAADEIPTTVETTVTADTAQAVGDLDQLETKARDAGGGVDDLSKSADSSKSVLANMVGNTTQDLGAMAGVAGSAGVAIGQMGEYMTDAVGAGDDLGTVLKNFGTMAGPLAALAAVSMVISEIKENSEKAKKRVEELADAQRDLAAGDTTTLIRTVAENYSDLALMAQDAGINVRDMIAALQNGEDLSTFRDRMIETNGSIAAANLLTDSFATEWGRASDQLNTNKDALTAVADAYGYALDPAGELVSIQETMTTAVDGVTEALGAATAALEEHLAAQRAAADAAFAVRDANDDFRDSLDQLPAKLKAISDSEATAEQKARDHQRALDDTTQAAITYADALVRQADETATASGHTLTASERTAIFRDGLLETAATADGEASQAIRDYVAEIDKIPPKKVLSLITETLGLTEANDDIDYAARDRDTKIHVEAVGLGQMVANVAATLASIGAGQRSAPSMAVTIHAPGGVYGDAGIRQLAAEIENAVAVRLAAGVRGG